MKRIYVGSNSYSALSSLTKTSTDYITRGEQKVAIASSTYRDAFQWPFAKDDAFNIGIGNNAQWSNSTDAITAFAQGGTGSGYVNGAQQNPSYSVPIYLAQSSSSTQNILSYTNILTPNNASPASGTDHHMTFVQPKTGSTYNGYGFWHVINTGNASPSTYTASYGGGPFDLSQYSTVYDGRASSILQMAGVIRPYDTTRGAIGHALAVALPQSSMTPGYVWPARSQDGSAATSYTAGANGIHMGMVFGIPSSVDLMSLGLTQGGILLANALQRYGAIVVDTGGSGGLLFMAEDEYDEGINTTSFTMMISQMNADITKIVSQVRVLVNQQSTQSSLTLSGAWGIGSTYSLAPTASLIG